MSSTWPAPEGGKITLAGSFINIEQKPISMNTIAYLVALLAFPLAARNLLSQPSITKQPVDFSVSLGASITNSISTATAPLSYQWRFNDAELPAATNRNLILTNIQVIDAGNYSVMVSDASGSVTSHVANLQVDSTFFKVTTGSIVTRKLDTIGGAWIDVNNDGNIDLFTSNGDATDNLLTDDLFLNNGAGVFTRSTSAQAGSIVTISSTGDVSFADYDNDGLPDVYSGAFQKPGRLYHNQGSGSFREITSFPSIPASEYPTGPTWGDYDHDGYLDLFVGTGWQYSPVKSWLFHNNKDGTFTRVTDSAVGRLVSELGNAGRCAWVDYDNDGDLDLFKSNIKGGCALYRNEGNGTFTKMTNSALALISTCYSSAWGDYDNDGNQDVFLQILGYPASIRGPHRNYLFHNQGDGTFLEVTNTVLTSEALRYLHAAWADYDNDGFLDLVVGADGNNHLYHNSGDGTFTEVKTGSVVNDGGTSWEVAWGDFDNDGFPDLFVGNEGFTPQAPFLYRNMGNSNHWLKFQLVGTTSNRSAIGAKVRMKATIRGRTMWQMRELSAQTDHGDQRPNFGLGEAIAAETVRIEWPSGIVQEFHDVTANRILAITEPVHLEVKGAGAFQFKSWKGMAFEIESSSSLSDWRTVSTVTNMTDTIEYSDLADTTDSMRFYRVKAK
jgi:hypothetical protein